MLTSWNAGFQLAPKPDPKNLSHMNVTTLSSGEVTWQDMLEFYSDSFPGYIALIVLDQSPESLKLATSIQERYLDIDRITDEHLLVLSTVPPPPEWYINQINRTRNLPVMAQRFARNEVYKLETKQGRQLAEINMQTLLAEYWDDELKLPGVCLFWQSPSVDDHGQTLLDAMGFNVSGFTSSDGVVNLFAQLAKFAKESKLAKNTSKEFATAAFTTWRPFPLKWKNNLSQLKTPLGQLAEMFSKMKSLVS